MKTALIGRSSLRASRLAYGCWRIADDPSAEGTAKGIHAVNAAYEAGYTLFDHADIYCDGRSETVFGQALKQLPGARERIVIATKCGIRKPGEPANAPYRYDFSAEYITWSCEQSLKRLGIETIDIYQLHRPDWLMNPYEVAGVFQKLRQQGKVREFGVSNFSTAQVRLLQRACSMPLLVNQVEISLAKLDAFTDGTLDLCLAAKITPMAWSPLAGGLLGDGARKLLPSQEGYLTTKVNEVLDGLAQAKGTNRTAMALAWLLKHPSGILPIVGSTDAGRIQAAAKADSVELTREEWYQVLEVARGERLP
jgi:predicted oxidoreductase